MAEKLGSILGAIIAAMTHKTTLGVLKALLAAVAVSLPVVGPILFNHAVSENKDVSATKALAWKNDRTISSLSSSVDQIAKAISENTGLLKDIDKNQRESVLVYAKQDQRISAAEERERNLKEEMMPMEKRVEMFVTRREYNDSIQEIRGTLAKIDRKLDRGLDAR